MSTGNSLEAECPRSTPCEPTAVPDAAVGASASEGSDEQMSPIATEPNDPKVVNWNRKKIFVLMALLECFVNYDLGAMAVMVPWIENPYGFTKSDLGVMGALPYLGLILLSPIIGMLFTTIKAQWIIFSGLAANALSLLVFALAYNKAMFYVARFLVGATQSFFVIYAPVWIGCFAPEANKNLWMAILQGSIAAGFMVGYVCTAIFKAAGEEGWRYSIAMQLVVVSLLSFFFARTPAEHVNLTHTEVSEADAVPQTALATLMTQMDRNSGSVGSLDVGIFRQHRNSRGSTVQPALETNETVSPMAAARPSFIGRRHTAMATMPSITNNASYYEWRRTSQITYTEPPCRADSEVEPVSIWRSLSVIISNPFFCSSTITLSALFYIVTAIQYWTTKLAVSLYGLPETLVYTIFVATASTAPTVGIIAGSWLIDRLNEKYPTKPIIIDLVLLSWSSVAMLCGLSAMLWSNVFNFVFSIWMILFFGAGILPPITLITIDTLPERLKPMASSICMCVYHILGYIAGTSMPGLVMDITNEDQSAIYATHIPSVFGVLGALGTTIARYRRETKAAAAEEGDSVCVGAVENVPGNSDWV
ncbi:integral membrane protein family I, putative [Babesia caballi]|uniref:Integral membrane protein family I, putative n=1 Tax=Babesia caballi TaxID=5871 RepID=A0AAV4LQ46_BABCB|nr:integral membrane protein family I, putative [Babesia caballi]